MIKAFDISKYRKHVTKNIQGISTGFRDPKVWLSTGNHALNYRISGDFNKGIPLGKVTMFAGESGSGKSFVCSGNIVKHAQDQGIFVILVDSENALDETWLHQLDVSTDENDLLKINAVTIDAVAKLVSDFVKQYRLDFEETPEDDRPKILFVIDSLGMLLTPTDIAQFEAGDMKGDMGRKAKQLKAIITNCVNLLADLDIGMVVTNHTYASQDVFDPEDKISGGSGPIFASSIVVAMKKLNLKEDEQGKKVTDIRGITAACKIMKTRFTKPFETIKVKIPYEEGMDKYSGLTEFFEKVGYLKKSGNRLSYVDKAGNEIIKFRNSYWAKNIDGMLDQLMKRYMKEVNNEG